jgi:hypothetical protein
MNTECSAERINFHGLGGRRVVGRFDGGRISSDGGCVLLREVEERTHILKRLAGCFVDHRDPELIEHSVGSLVKQRVYGIALGYEDLNDHDTLRYDALLGLLADKEDPSGAGRRRTEDRGKALAGKSTLNRLELTPKEAGKQDRYKKIVAQTEAMDTLLVEVFVESHAVPPKEIVIDVDATDDPLHGDQEGRFFHGYYGHYCYLPLYFFSGDRLLCARLREADEEPATGCVEELSRIVAQVRAAWPEVRIVVRGDSGFCREAIMSWCETHGVEYVLGLAKNSRLTDIIAGELAKARGAYEASGEAARWFKDFRYQTRESWTCERRVVGKAEYLAKGENPRFIVTSLAAEDWEARALYEDLYCARGEMENRIKEQQLQLFADRTSTHAIDSNQLRLYFSSFAYVLIETLRALGLSGTELAQAQCGTIRLKLFKVGAQVRLSVRNIWIAFSEAYPYARLFQAVLDRLRQIPLTC